MPMSYMSSRFDEIYGKAERMLANLDKNKAPSKKKKPTEMDDIDDEEYVAKGPPKRLLITPNYPKFVFEKPKQQTFKIEEDDIDDVDTDTTRNLSGAVVKTFMEGSQPTPRMISISGDVKPSRRISMQNIPAPIPVANLKPEPTTSARLQAEPKPKRVTKPKVPKVPKDEYTSLKVVELKETLRALGLKVSGRKDVLIERLKEWQLRG